MSSTSSERYRTVAALHVTLRRVIWDHVDKPDDMRLARIGLNAPRNLTQSRAGDTFDKCQSIDPSSFHQTLPLPKNKQCCISVAKTLVYLVVQVL